jgi:DNA-binding NtrC family response regulator
MKRGAADYLRKPLSSPDELTVLVRKTLNHQRIADERGLLREEAENRFSANTFITDDPDTLKILDMARRVAVTDTTVLVLGESGTGKEVMARYIHRHSSRCEGPFVAVNCAALSPSLIESELFGHEKGAFTGALSRHIGRFERAQRGTLFSG